MQRYDAPFEKGTLQKREVFAIERCVISDFSFLLANIMAHLLSREGHQDFVLEHKRYQRLCVET